jgi:hypothetical protein
LPTRRGREYELEWLSSTGAYVFTSGKLEGTAFVAPQVLVDVNHGTHVVVSWIYYLTHPPKDMDVMMVYSILPM